MDLTFDTDVKCKCNGACTNFKWFKNGLIMYNDTNLNNKSDSIAYHAIRESVAMYEPLTANVPTLLNPSDLCTKVVPGGMKRNNLVSILLYDIAD